MDENPWKNRAELYFRLNTIEKTQEEFDTYLKKKTESTENLLNVYNKSNLSEKHDLAETYKLMAKVKKYKKNFVAVDTHSGSDLKPIFNKLVMISEMRAFEIQQYDYKDRFSVFCTLSKEISEIEDINYHLDMFYSFSDIIEKYKYLCSLEDSVALSCLPHLPESFVNYYTVLGPEKMRALRYNATDMRKAYENLLGDQLVDVRTPILSEFLVGEKYTKTDIKNKLKRIYDSVGYSRTPKAVDLEDYFIINTCRIQNIETGKRDAGYLIVSIKPDI